MQVSDAYWIDEDGNLVEMRNGVPETSCWCSRCKHWLVASDEYDVYGYYCPYCGAPMNKEKQPGVVPGTEKGKIQQ